VTVVFIRRSPGSNFDTFNGEMENMFSAVNNKSLFICGDFNIDLLNPNKHKLTDELIERMHSMS